MLINFTIENFLSFKERQQFSMRAGLGGKNKAHHVIPKAHSRDVRLVKAGIIYGANASGKSNLVKAIHFAQQMILEGTAPGTPIEHNPFRLDAQYATQPTRIEFEIKHRGRAYSYGFVFDREAVKEEWLYRMQRNSEKMLFERQGKSFNIEPLKSVNDSPKEKQFLEFAAVSTPSNLLFLTDVRRRDTLKDHVSDIRDLENVIDWFQNVLTVVHPGSKALGLEFELKNDDQLRETFRAFLRYFDTGIEAIELQETAIESIQLPENIKEHLRSKLLDEHSEKVSALFDNPMDNVRYLFSTNEAGSMEAHKLSTVHRVNNATQKEHQKFFFDICEESDGTQRIMDFIPMLVDLLKDDNVFVVDEIDRSLHSKLAYDLLDLYLSMSTDVQSQLIATTHSEHLMTQELLRRDELWIVEKNSKGASSIYSLNAFEDIRSDKQVQKDYLMGRYGGIPRLGSRRRLLNVVQPLTPLTTPS